MRPRARSGYGATATGANVERRPGRRALERRDRRHGSRVRAGSAAPGHGRRRLRLRARGALLRVPGAGRVAVADRGEHRRAAGDDPARAGQDPRARARARARGGGRVTPRIRLGMFLLAAAAFAVVLVAGFTGLPDFGHYTGPYG